MSENTDADLEEYNACISFSLFVSVGLLLDLNKGELLIFVIPAVFFLWDNFLKYLLHVSAVREEIKKFNKEYGTDFRATDIGDESEALNALYNYRQMPKEEAFKEMDTLDIEHSK
jgi:hypothetical protein